VTDDLANIYVRKWRREPNTEKNGGNYYYSQGPLGAAADNNDSMIFSLIYKYRRWYKMCNTTFQLKNIKRKVLNCSSNAFYYCIFILYIVFKDCHTELDVRGSVHHSTIHKEKSNKMQQCIKSLLFHMYMKLNMFRATHRPSSGA